MAKINLPKLSKASKYKVLVIDDDRDILDLLQYNLEKEGYQVETVYDARKALKAAEAFHPDLILLDIMMPYHDGIDICRQIREKSKMNNPAVVSTQGRWLLTGLATQFS